MPHIHICVGGVGVIPIILAGGENDYAMGGVLYERLRKHAEVLYIRGGMIHHSKNGRQSFIIYELPEHSDISGLASGIVIIKENAKHIGNLPQKLPIIVGSDNYAALKCIPCGCKSIITCGMSVRDTLSLSANVGGRASVSLQRRIRNIYGRWISECELPLKCDGMTDYQILALTAVLLICGVEG